MEKEGRQKPKRKNLTLTTESGLSGRFLLYGGSGRKKKGNRIGPYE